MVDEEVAIKIYFTGVVWILSCGIRILLHLNKDHKRREALARATSSSTACAVGKLSSQVQHFLEIKSKGER